MAHKKKMNAAALAAYREENINFLANLEGKPGIQNLRCGVKYRVITPAPPAPEGATERTLRKLQSTPQPRSVVTVHYEGKLIDGKQFDSSRRGSGAPAVFRVNELITGWQVALVQHAHRREVGNLRSCRSRIWRTRSRSRHSRAQHPDFPTRIDRHQLSL